MVTTKYCQLGGDEAFVPGGVSSCLELSYESTGVCCPYKLMIVVRNASTRWKPSVIYLTRLVVALKREKGHTLLDSPEVTSSTI